MRTTNPTTERVFQLFTALGADPTFARSLIATLEGAGIGLADQRNDELVVRWVNVLERAVPPEADTIIRTITGTAQGRSTSTTHWLDGLRGPNV